MSAQTATILFDGVCNLCSASVRFIIRRDRGGYYRFASLQSAAGARLAAEHGIDAPALDSIVLLEHGRAWRRSDAALRIARHLGGVWPLLGMLRIVPRPVRDHGYDWIARNRYRWFGRTAECMVPTPELSARFVPDEPTS